MAYANIATDPQDVYSDSESKNFLATIQSFMDHALASNYTFD